MSRPSKCFKSQTITLLRDIKHILHGTTIKLKEQHEETSIGCWAKESHALCMFSVRNAENNYVTWMKLFICVPVIVNLQNNEEIPHPCNLALTKFDSLMPWQHFSQFLMPGQNMLQKHRYCASSIDRKWISMLLFFPLYNVSHFMFVHVQEVTKSVMHIKNNDINWQWKW